MTSRVNLWIVGLSLLMSAARADIISLTGGTTGTFNPAQPRLAFAGSNFNVTTNLAGSASVNLGWFSLPNCPPALFSACDSFNNDSFTLNVTFLLPVGVAGSPAPFTAQLGGAIGRFLGIPLGGALIDFDNSWTTFNYANSSGTGSFQFRVDDTAVGTGNAAALTGGIRNATVNPVPEPASIALFGGVLIAVGIACRRKPARM